MGRKTVCSIAEGQRASPRRGPRWWKRLRGRLQRRAWQVEWPRELNPFVVEFMWHAEVMARLSKDPESFTVPPILQFRTLTDLELAEAARRLRRRANPVGRLLVDSMSLSGADVAHRADSSMAALESRLAARLAAG